MPLNEYQIKMRNVQTMTGQGHFYFSYIRKL